MNPAPDEPTAFNRQDVFDDLIGIVDSAGAIIMDHYGQVCAELKADHSPVTAADIDAEDFILAALADLTPDIPVVAEEQTARGQASEETHATFWLVDPLDGTREFISGNGEFTVNIALIEDRVPTMAFVGAPARQMLFASNGCRAFRRTAESDLLPITVRKARSDDLTVAVSRSHSNAETETMTRWLGCKHRLTGGSSLKFCLIAEGSADLYPRLGPTMEWDTAAGHGILRAAGGHVLNLDGQELIYGKTGFRNADFLACGDLSADNRLRAVVKSALESAKMERCSQA